MDLEIDAITSTLSQLNLNPKSNFQECSPDPDQPPPAHPSVFVRTNDWFYECYNLVFTTICTYACLFPLTLIQNVLYGYRRAKSDPVAAESFFNRYDVQEFDVIKDDHYYQALDIVTEWFRPKNLIHPVHFTDLRWYPWNLSTSAEQPFSSDPDLKRKLQVAKELGLISNARMSFHNCYQEIFTYCRNYTHRIKEGLHVPLHYTTMHQKPALTTIDKPEKVRSVFGVSKCLIFIEAMFMWPLFSHYHVEKNHPLLWGYETLNGGWSRLNDEYVRKYQSFKPVFNLDWSEFDMYFYYSVWRDIRAKVKTYFCFCGRYHPTRTYPSAQTSPSRIERLWTFIGHAYENTICVSPLGRLIKKLFAGMPSGIFCTQFYDSFYNAVMTVTILLALGFTVTSDHFIKLMGDDVLFGLLQMLPISQWADFLQAFSEEAKRRFNSRLSPDKCGVSLGITGATVLSYENYNGYPIRDPQQLLAQLLHPRSLRDSPPRLMARAIGIYFASAGDPRLRPICEHIFSELQSLGYETHKRTFDKMFPPEVSLLSSTDIDLTHFPSQTSVICRLLRPSVRNQDIQDKYWPLDHFLIEAGSCLH
jgi:hypothetical protein